jgi:hypothetical protein
MTLLVGEIQSSQNRFQAEKSKVFGYLTRFRLPVSNLFCYVSKVYFFDHCNYLTFFLRLITVNNPQYILMVQLIQKQYFFFHFLIKFFINQPFHRKLDLILPSHNLVALSFVILLEKLFSPADCPFL